MALPIVCLFNLVLLERVMVGEQSFYDTVNIVRRVKVAVRRRSEA